MADVITAGQITLTGAAQSLAGVLPGPAAGCRLKALGAGGVYIGAVGVSNTTGYFLKQDESIDLSVINPGKVYLIGTAAEKVHYLVTSG